MSNHSKTYLVTGGLERSKNPDFLEGRGYDTGKIIRLDIENQKTEDLVVFNEQSKLFDKANYPDEYPNILMTAGAVKGDAIWISSESEIFEYSYPQFELRRRVSLPCFQNIHHVNVLENNIAVVSTGLDMIVLLDMETLEPESFINVEGKDAWHRFDKNVDYRKVHSTKPHDCHPNYVFEFNGDIWVTRLKQQDVVNISNPKQKIAIGGGGIHDGIVKDGYIYFTCVVGEIVIVNATTLKVENRIDLRKIEGTDRPLGWCRGISIEDNIVHVAFSHLRPTKIRENISWARDVLTGGIAITKTRVVGYDINKKEKIGEYIMPKNSISAIYSIIPENS